MKLVKAERKDTKGNVEFFVTVAFGALEINVLTEKTDQLHESEHQRRTLLALMLRALDALYT